MDDYGSKCTKNLHMWVCFDSVHFICVYWLARQPEMLNNYEIEHD